MDHPDVERLREAAASTGTAWTDWKREKLDDAALTDLERHAEANATVAGSVRRAFIRKAR